MNLIYLIKISLYIADPKIFQNLEILAELREREELAVKEKNPVSSQPNLSVTTTDPSSSPTLVSPSERVDRWNESSPTASAAVGKFKISHETPKDPVPAQASHLSSYSPNNH